MDLSDLEVFRAVAQTGGVTRAAQALHRVPSNVTTRLRQLEADLGTALFLRERNRLAITPAGELLLDYAHRILGLAQEARAALQDAQPRGRLRLGAMESTAAVRLPTALARFHHSHPQVNLELCTGPTRDLLARVLGGELDAAFVADPSPHERLQTQRAYSETMVLVADAAQGKVRSAKDLARPCVLGFGSGCSYRRRLESWFAAGAVDVQGVVELNSYHAILACAVAGMGVALLPQAMLDIFPDRQRLSVHALPRAWRQSQTHLVWRKGSRSPGLAALCHIVSQA